METYLLIAIVVLLVIVCLGLLNIHTTLDDLRKDLRSWREWLQFGPNPPPGTAKELDDAVRELEKLRDE